MSLNTISCPLSITLTHETQKKVENVNKVKLQEKLDEKRKRSATFSKTLKKNYAFNVGNIFKL